ncbi:PAS-domain containing protein [Tistrella sp. BH-R2-4]|uniref:histidine kinase n=1 Tax=Tistrella arctica TaxID=3133430 RepID=A0ABU9YKE9_9PROT
MHHDRPATLVRSLTVAAVVVGAILAGLVMMQGWRSHTAAMHDAGRRATGLALLLAEHAARSMDAVDIEMARVEDQIRAQDSLPDRRSRTWFDRLTRIAADTPQIKALWLVDPAGQVVQLTHGFPAPLISVADRTYFARAIAGTGGLLMDPPVLGEVTGAWYVPTARAVRGTDGRLIGVVGAAVDPAYFIRVYRSVDVGDAGRLLLLDGDGRKLGAVPDGRPPRDDENPPRADEDLPLAPDAIPASGAPPVAAANPAGLGRAWVDPARIDPAVAMTDPDDGVARIYGTADVPGRPLVVAAGLSVADIRTDWAAGRATDLALLAAMVLVLALTLAFLRTRIVAPVARLHAAVADLGPGRITAPLPMVGGAREIVELAAGIEAMRAALDRNTRSLEDEVALRTAEATARGALLDSAFSALGQGIAIFDPDLFLIACNRQYLDLLGLPPDAARPGTPLAAIVAAALPETLPDEARTPRIARRLELARNRAPASLMERTASGRVIEIAHNPIPDGGSVAIYKDVTEAQQIEKALRDSEWRYRLLAENAGDLILRQSPDGTILYASPAAHGLLGMEPDTLIGRRLADLVVPEDSGILAEHMAALDDQGRHRATLRLRHATGRPVWVEAGARMIRHTRTGAPSELHASLRDVGERVAADRALAENARLLSTTLDSMRQGLCLIDGSFRVVLHNRRFLDMNGLQPEECPPLADFEQIMHLMAGRGEFGDDPAFRDVARRMQALRRPWPQSWERRRPDGTVIEVASAPFPGGGLVMTFADVTNRRQAEQALARQGEVLRVTIDAMDQGLMLSDRDFNIVVVNRRYQDLLEIPAGIARPGNPVAEVIRFTARRGEFGPGDPDRLAAAWMARMRDPALIGQPVEHPRPDGRLLEIIRLPVDDGGMLSIYTDVTDRRRVQDALETARERALDAADARARFLATVSHEIRNPLNSILNALHFIEDTDLDAEQAGLAQIMRRASELLLDLLDDVLDLSRIEAGKLVIDPRPFDPLALARDVKALFDPQARRKGLVLDVAAAASDLPARLVGDHRRLRQILVNLTGNAIKFTDQGRVTIAVTLRPGTGDGAPGTTGHLPVLRFEVIDTGIGIPAEQTRQLFEEYFQARADTMARGRDAEADQGNDARQGSDPARGPGPGQDGQGPEIDTGRPVGRLAGLGGGAGLGLAIVRRLTELLGGCIGCDSVPGEGSRFWFEVPAAPVLAGNRPPMPADAAPPGAPSLRALPGGRAPNDIDSLPRVQSGPEIMSRDVDTDAAPAPGSVRILLAEDNAMNQMLTARALDRAGYRVDTVGEGTAAVDAAAGTRYDLILMDVQMPGLSGLEATRRIRALPDGHGLMPIVALTANAGREAEDVCRAAGMDDHLSKPFRRDELVAMVHRWLKRPSVSDGRSG